jgi:hypothetical protein
MKRFIKILVLFIMISLPAIMIAQTPPHPNNGSAPGSGNTPVGGGAPIDGGITLLLTLVGLYGGRKAYQFRKK